MENSQPSPEALALITTAAVAAGPAPAGALERAAWLGDVTDLATTLYRKAQEVDAELVVLAEVRVIRGVILTAEAHSSRGLITIRPTMGNHSDDPNATEVLRTPWLNEPRGAALLAQAQALAGTGAMCRFGKWNEVIDAGSQKGNKRGMVAWIEAAGAGPTDQPQPRAETQGSTAQAHTGPTTNGAGPQPEPSAAERDLVKLRNIRLGNHSQLVAAARDHLGMGTEAIGAVEMELCGAAGAATRAQLMRVWNEAVTRSLQPA